MRTSILRLAIPAAVALLIIGFIQTQHSWAQVQMSPVERGYYDEGYQDGVNDAQSNRSNDYRRYRNKFESRYESFYKQGYQEGYNNIRPTLSWNSDQKRAYDTGYNYGRDDARRNHSRSPERFEGNYDAAYSAYFLRGYDDGYAGRSRQYNVGIVGLVIPGLPTLPPGNTRGNIVWTGRVDDRVNITITGSIVQTAAVSGGDVSRVNYSMNKTFPRRAVTITVNKRRGRGEVSVIQQPDRNNNYTAIVQVYDSARGASDYELEIGWDVTNAEEPYQAGRVTWSGRVDNRVNVVITGDYVQSVDVAGTGMSGVNYNMSGYLARRTGNLVNVNKIRGRGTVMVIQQPDWNNDFTAIVQIVDDSRGADNYQIEIGW
jgi:hypothetical protein